MEPKFSLVIHGTEASFEISEGWQKGRIHISVVRGEKNGEGGDFSTDSFFNAIKKLYDEDF